MEMKFIEKHFFSRALTLKLIIFREKERPDIRYILKGDRSSLLPSPPNFSIYQLLIYKKVLQRRRKFLWNFSSREN